MPQQTCIEKQKGRRVREGTDESVYTNVTNERELFQTF
jgi:hypothetical protein